jgi:hypothetical protein
VTAAPFIAEAERAVAEALAATDELDILDRGECTDAAIVAVAAVVPILAEHFAQAVEARAVQLVDGGASPIDVVVLTLLSTATLIRRESAAMSTNVDIAGMSAFVDIREAAVTTERASSASERLDCDLCHPEVHVGCSNPQHRRCSVHRATPTEGGTT